MTSTLRTTLDRALAVLGLVLVVATGVVFVASGGGGDSTAAAPAAEAVAADTVDIADFEFAAVSITVPAGTKVTWTNRDAAPHTATSGTGAKPDGVFDTGTLAKGDKKTVTLSKAGTLAYYCALHPFMKGTVTVT